MATVFDLKQDDIFPALRARLRDGRGTAIDLSLATVAFRMRATGGALKIDDAACDVVDAAGGIVEYQWAAGDTDTPGTYDGEFVISYAGGVQTVPATGYVSIVVSANLA